MPTSVSVSCPLNSLHNSFFIVRQMVIGSLSGQFTVCDDHRHADIHIHVGNPEEKQLDYLRGRLHKTILFSFCEATRIPGRWVEYFNRAKEVWVPSEFCRNVFTECGVTNNIRIVPLGIDTPKDYRRNKTRHPDSPYTVLWQGVTGPLRLEDGSVVDGDRKRAKLVRDAFEGADIPNSRLIIKSVPLRSREFDFRVDPVWEICGSSSARQMALIDREVDLFVWPTYGEAFGLLPLEKLAQGIPVLVTNWAGTTDYLKDFPLPHLDTFNLKSITYGGIEAEMAEVDAEVLTAAIRAAFARREHLAALSEDLHNIAHEKWNYRRSMRPAVLQGISEMAQA